jgi:hypothetical protein
MWGAKYLVLILEGYSITSDNISDLEFYEGCFWDIVPKMDIVSKK